MWDTLKEEEKLEEANTRTWPFGEKAEKEIDRHGELPHYERKLVICLCDTDNVVMFYVNLFLENIIHIL